MSQQSERIQIHIPATKANAFGTMFRSAGRRNGSIEPALSVLSEKTSGAESQAKDERNVFAPSEA